MAVDPVGLTGLVIALVALVIALFQMLQALFATADGYRNCKPAVMGDWGVHPLTRRNFVPWEIRVETIYTVPFISMGGFLGDGFSTVDGATTSREVTHCKQHTKLWWRERNATSEMATWLFLLDQLHELGSGYRTFTQNGMATEKGDLFIAFSSHAFWYHPILSERQRSWDFTSDQVNKPLAVSNISSIAIMVRRLGMTWTQFQPSDSLFRAEGNGMTLDSTKISAVGTVLEFSRIERLQYAMKQAELYIPSTLADMLGFGIIMPWYSTLGESELSPASIDTLENKFLVGTNDDCLQTMIALCGEGDSTRRLRESLTRGYWTPGFSDIIPFTAPLMYAKKTGINQVPQPAQYVTGPTVYPQAYQVFRDRLTLYVNDLGSDGFEKDQLTWIVRSYDELQATGRWDTEENSTSMNEDDIKTLDLMADKLMEAEKWLMAQSEDTGYQDLLACHIQCAVGYKEETNEMYRRKGNFRIPKGKMFTTGDGPWKCRSMHRYMDYILQDQHPDYIYQLMKDRGYSGTPLLLATAWFTMMFRGFCWQRIHNMVPGPRVGSRWWNSRLPVYIT